MTDLVPVELESKEVSLQQESPVRSPHRGSLQNAMQPLQHMPVPFAPSLLMPATSDVGFRAAKPAPSQEKSPPVMVQRPVPQHAAAVPLNMQKSRFGSQMFTQGSETAKSMGTAAVVPASSGPDMPRTSSSRSSSISSTVSYAMEKQLSKVLTFKDSASAVLDVPNYREQFGASAPINAFVVQNPESQVLWAGQAPHVPPSGFQENAQRRRVTVAVADLPSYGKVGNRRGSALAAAKKRKRSANISELTFSRIYKPNEPPYNLIRIWVNERNMQFYDCECGRRKAVQDLQKIVRHAEKCYYKNPPKSSELSTSEANKESEKGDATPKP